MPPPQQTGGNNHSAISISDGGLDKGKSSLSAGIDGRSHPNVVSSQVMDGDSIESAGQHRAPGSDYGSKTAAGVSQHSMASDPAALGVTGKELDMSLYFKLKGIKWNIFSLVNNIVLLAILGTLNGPSGLLFSFGPDAFTLA
jgi:hypothetical protein